MAAPLKLRTAPDPIDSEHERATSIYPALRLDQSELTTTGGASTYYIFDFVTTLPGVRARMTVLLWAIRWETWDR